MKFLEGNVIKFYRGDDDAILIALKNDLTFETGDSVFFSLKLDPEDETDVLQIESTSFVEHEEVANAAALITIDHDDTIALDIGIYYYDILIHWANDTNTTVIAPTKFKLVPGGSHGSV